MSKNILLLGASGTAGSGVRKALLSKIDVPFNVGITTC